ncbi:MAG: hypothetical protein AB3N23_15785, partial [Paracoccaceae bacterium]
QLAPSPQATRSPPITRIQRFWFNLIHLASRMSRECAAWPGIRVSSLTGNALAPFLIASVLAAGSAIAKATPTTIITPPGGASEFCYFNGLAYSKNAIVLIDITNRRESPQATQKAMLVCQAAEGSDALQWERIDAE